MGLRAFLIVAAVAGAAVLAACETMSAEECAGADWRALGYADAAQNGADRLSARSESCADKGVLADAAAYRAGVGEGLYEFCRPERAFAFARNGGSFTGRCPGELEQDFRAAFFDGERVHDAQEVLQQARSQVSSLESRRNEIDDNIGSRERSLADAATDQLRNEHRAEIERLRRERRDVNDDIRTAQAQLPRLQRMADDLRYEIGSRWGAWR